MTESVVESIIILFKSKALEKKNETDFFMIFKSFLRLRTKIDQNINNEQKCGKT